MFFCSFSGCISALHTSVGPVGTCSAFLVFSFVYINNSAAVSVGTGVLGGGGVRGTRSEDKRLHGQRDKGGSLAFLAFLAVLCPFPYSSYTLFGVHWGSLEFFLYFTNAFSLGVPMELRLVPILVLVSLVTSVSPSRPVSLFV